MLPLRRNLLQSSSVSSAVPFHARIPAHEMRVATHGTLNPEVLSFPAQNASTDSHPDLGFLNVLL